MGVEHLPLYKTSLALAVYMEQIVRVFEKYQLSTPWVKTLETRAKDRDD